MDITSFDGHHLAPERLSLLLHFHLVAFHIAEFALDSLAQLVKLLRLLLELVYLVLLCLPIRTSHDQQPSPLCHVIFTHATLAGACISCRHVCLRRVLEAMGATAPRRMSSVGVGTQKN